jgi:hypothetical protein
LNQYCKDLDCCFVPLEVLDSLGIVSGAYIRVAFSKQNGREEYVIVPVMGCLSDRKTTEAISVLMSPISLYKLGITTFHQRNLHIQISVPQTIIYKEIIAVTLSHIAGYSYPENTTENDVEKLALQSFFSRSQRITLGDVICVSASGLQNRSIKPVSVLMKNSIVSSRSDEDFLFMYLIKDIAIDEKCHIVNSSEKSNSDQKITGSNMKNIHHSSNKNGSINNKIILSSTDMNDLCTDSSHVDNSDDNGNVNESIISSSSLITAITQENNADVCPEMPSLIINITSKDITKIVLKGSSNCRVFDINMLTDHYHDLYNAIPLEKNSQKDDDYQENFNGDFLSVRSQWNLLATSVGELVDALSPRIRLASDSLDSYKSITENQYLNDEEKNNSNTNNSNKKSDYSHYITDSALYSLITSPLLIECSCGEHGTYI